jgi:hypothetical protein
MRVAVIGCGVAGMAAAHAACGLADEVDIYAPKRKTPQRGPIMLHQPIPGINNAQPDGYVRQIVIGGSILDYRLKLYGDVNIAINGDILEAGFHTWRVPEAYDEMWNRYSHLIQDTYLEPIAVKYLAGKYDLVVNTAPVPNICLKPSIHKFNSVDIALLLEASYPNQPANTVVYNSYPDIKWVRSSRIFEAECTEYKPEDAPLESITIHKPLSTTCNCHPRVLRTGRFGKWHNETWINHSYYDTRTALVSMMNQKTWDSVI